MPIIGKSADDPLAEVDLAIDAPGDELLIDPAGDRLIVQPGVTWPGKSANEDI